MLCQIFFHRHTVGRNKPVFFLVAACLILGYLLSTAQASEPKSITSNNAMISTANALATEAGLAILRKGGAAVDAAIASQMVLGLVEPQSSLMLTPLGEMARGIVLAPNSENICGATE